MLYFYPRDFTFVCTQESCGFRDDYAQLQGLGAEVLGVSGDAPASHARFKERHQLPFPLLSDADGHVRRLYGVKPFWGLVPGRVTFVVDEAGLVRRRIQSQYRGRHHVDEALEAVRSLTRPGIRTRSPPT